MPNIESRCNQLKFGHPREAAVEFDTIHVNKVVRVGQNPELQFSFPFGTDFNISENSNYAVVLHERLFQFLRRLPANRTAICLSHMNRERWCVTVNQTVKESITLYTYVPNRNWVAAKVNRDTPHVSGPSYGDIRLGEKLHLFECRQVILRVCFGKTSSPFCFHLTLNKTHWREVVSISPIEVTIHDFAGFSIRWYERFWVARWPFPNLERNLRCFLLVIEMHSAANSSSFTARAEKQI